MQALRYRTPITPEGRAELEDEIAYLRQMRQDILSEPQRWQLVDPGEVDNEITAVERQILRLRETLVFSVPVGTDLIVGVGSQVTVIGEQGKETFVIVGPLSANAYSGRISYESPLGRALLGRGLGEEVEVASAQGVRRLRVVDISGGGQGGAASQKGAA